jgi:hypothetical protein
MKRKTVARKKRAESDLYELETLLTTEDNMTLIS